MFTQICLSGHKIFKFNSNNLVNDILPHGLAYTMHIILLMSYEKQDFFRLDTYIGVTSQIFQWGLTNPMGELRYFW